MSTSTDWLHTGWYGGLGGDFDLSNTYSMLAPLLALLSIGIGAMTLFIVWRTRRSVAAPIRFTGLLLLPIATLAVIGFLNGNSGIRSIGGSYAHGSALDGQWSSWHYGAGFYLVVLATLIIVSASVLSLDLRRSVESVQLEDPADLTTVG